MFKKSAKLSFYGFAMAYLIVIAVLLSPCLQGCAKMATALAVFYMACSGVLVISFLLRAIKVIKE